MALNYLLRLFFKEKIDFELTEYGRDEDTVAWGRVIRRDLGDRHTRCYLRPPGMLFSNS